MRKKIIPIILAAALLLAGLGIYVSANRSRTQMQLMGQAYAEASGRTDDPVIAAFKGTEIRQSRIDYEKQIMTVMEGRTTAGDAQALNRRLRNLAMLEEAERRGLTVTQEEVNYELNGQRQLYADEEGVREMLDDYCENAGITIEQHFSMQEELMPHYILRQKLRDALGQEYCAQHGLEFTRVNPPQEMLDYLSRYLEGLLDTYRADITYYPGELSAEQIAWFNHDYFNLDGEAGVRNMMLSSTYQDVRDIDLYRLFYNGVPGTANDISKEERDALYALDTSAEHLDLIKVTPQQMDDVLQTYAGIGLAQTAMRGLDGMHYLERYDAYYMIHSDYLDARLAREAGERAEKQSAQAAAPKRTRERELRMSYKEQRDYETIDARMAQLQGELEALDRQIERNASDFVKLTELTQKREATRLALDEAEDRWLYLTDLAERIEAQKKS